MADSTEKKSIMRCLGEFTGYIAKGIRTKVDAPRTEEVTRSVEETRDGDVTLRRTVIEEVEYHGNAKEDQSCS